METQVTIQSDPEPRRGEKDWAEAEWFLEWLRLARRDYQGNPPPSRPEFRQAA